MESADPADASAADLVAHLAWVQRLARALVRDADRAEDLTQEAARVTLEQPSGRVRGPQMKSWLRGVVLRLVVDRTRADTSRRDREKAVAPRESEPATHEIVARLDQQQRVAQAVRALAEPYRSTILYRYLDQLSTREVAHRMGVDDELVRKRLARGLAQLRERLDAEFGSDTKSWAIALLSLPGAAVVSVKAKVAVAAVVMVAAAITWRAVLPAGEHRKLEPPPAVAAAAPAVASAVTSPIVPADAAVRETARDVGVKEFASPNATGEATILHVSVVTAEKRPCMSGHLAGFWSEGIYGGESPRSIEEEIAGPVTDLVLPVTAASVTLTASVDGHSSSKRTWITELRKEKEPKERHGRVEKSVTIEVGGHETGPRLTGQILVDGLPRVPRGLDFFIQSEPGRGDDEARFRVHALDCRYEVGPIHPRIQSLVVTSDETVPRQIDLDLDGRDATQDLELETGKTLRLTVVDRRTEQRLAGVELYLSIGYVTKRTLLQRHWRDHSHFMRSGHDGVAVVTGLPTRGRFDIRRDASNVVRTLEVNAGEKMEQRVMSEPLLSFELTKESPQVIEKTLRFDPEGHPRRIFGQLAATFLAEGDFGEEAAEVHYATMRGDGRWYRDDYTIEHDERGRWSLDVKPDTEYRIFVERERRRVSQVASVKVADDDVGPIDLASRPGTDVLLRLIRCPAEGFVSISVSDPGAVTPLGTTRAIHGGTFERRLRLEGPSTLSVSCFKEMSTHQTAARKTIQVDPTTMPVVEIDLACPDARDVEFTLSPIRPPEEGYVQLIRLAGDGDARVDVSVSVAIVAGRCRNQVAVAPGRYLYSFLPRIADALILGVVDVPAGPPDRPIVIHCDLEPHPKSELGAGVEITELGGQDVKGLWPTLLRRRLVELPTGGGDSLLLPAGAKFTVIEK